jgi:hypothetical protein
MSPLGPPQPTEYGGTIRLRAAPPTEARVQAFEAQVGARLPDDFRRFLLQYNGGKPLPSGFRMALRTGPYADSLVHSLDSLYDEDICNLESTVRWQRVPFGVITIGCDPGGNGICLVIAGERRGQIWFWDHEHEMHPPDWSNMDFVAPSFDAFMRGLTPVD